VQLLTSFRCASCAEYLARYHPDARGDDIACAFRELSPKLPAVLDDAAARRDHIGEPGDQITLAGQQHQL
jgi:hypothetical protein